jgi:hypothetical protein
MQESSDCMCCAMDKLSIIDLLVLQATKIDFDCIVCSKCYERIISFKEM